MRDIYRKRGNKGKPSEFRASAREPDSGMVMESQASFGAEAWELDSGMDARERTLTVPPPYGRTHECKGNLGRCSTLKRHTGEGGSKVNIEN
jgi:hypothetical protein